jgi:hypothetical protein
MQLSRRAFLAGLALGAGALCGCGSKPKGMPNMQLQSGPAVQRDLPVKNKKIRKPMPPDPPGPKAPP